MQVENNNDSGAGMENKILESARNLFLEKGFSKTSTTEIAKQAGCNQALVHYYFRTKEKLFCRIFKAQVGIFASAFLDEGNNPGKTFEEKLRHRIGRHFDIISGVPKLPALILTDMIDNEGRIKLLKESIGDIPAKVFDSLNKELKVEIENGNIRSVSAKDLLITVLSLNIFLFLALPVFSAIFELDEKHKQEMLLQRKEEIINTVILSLRPI